MMRWMALAVLCVLLAACSPAAPTSIPANPPATQAAPATGTAGSQGPAPMAVTANPPHVPVNPPGGSGGGRGWQSYSSPPLGVAVDYPPSWTLTQQADGAVFTAPTGETVQLQAAAPAGAGSGSSQCTKLINGNGLQINACVDSATGLYSAEASVGGSHKVWLFTSGKEVLGAYNRMMDSLRALQ